MTEGLLFFFVLHYRKLNIVGFWNVLVLFPPLSYISQPKSLIEESKKYFHSIFSTDICSIFQKFGIQPKFKQRAAELTDPMVATEKVKVMFSLTLSLKLLLVMLTGGLPGSWKIRKSLLRKTKRVKCGNVKRQILHQAFTCSAVELISVKFMLVKS